MNRKLYGTSRLGLVIILSFASLAFLVVLRYLVAGRFSQGYLVWNLALAAVPVLIAAAGAKRQFAASSRRRSVAWGVGGFVAWLAFYPNAPYIFTDFIHVIRRGNLGTPAASWMSEVDLLWFDIVLNSAFAFVGHYLGLISMYMTHGTMRRLFGRVAGWVLLAPAILLSGFGIHLGRFSRFNSWDLVFNPLEAVRAALATWSDPATILFSFAFALFIALTYIIHYLVQGAFRDSA